MTILTHDVKAKKDKNLCLVYLAVKYLSAPGSSVHLGRPFSKAEIFNEKKRSKLLPDNVEVSIIVS